jgi:ribonuclease R
MLPEKLSNDLCSLRPDEDRPCLAAHLWIDAQGRKLRHRFVRGMMRSAARLTYRKVEDERAVHPHLYAAYAALRHARQARGTLDLDLPERRIVMNDQGRIERIFPRPRYDSHRLIEEFMILANVAAAEALEGRRAPVMYRVHDAPSPEKLEALRAFLAGIGFAFAKGQVPRASAFENILARAANSPHARVVNEMILRSQAQAIYDPANIGHFGLALRRYCHFTSPIRRYADLIVHRALITAFGLGEDGLPAGSDPAGFAALATHVSATERRAAKAERDTADRLVAAFLSQSVGATFDGRIQGVTRFGLFVHLEETGADGLLPISALGAERFRLDEARHTLTGERTRTSYALGDDIAVRLAEANPLTGGIVFALAQGGRQAPPRRPDPRPARAKRRKPGRRKLTKR